MAAGTRTNINAHRKAAAQAKMIAPKKKTKASGTISSSSYTGGSATGVQGASSYVPPKNAPGLTPTPTPAAAPAAPATATVTTTPTVEPFWTPDQAMAWANQNGSVQGQLYDLDTALQHLGTNTTEQEQQIDTQKEKDLSSTIDNMIGRGLAQSSIKDGDLYDIGATAALKKAYLDTALATATIETGRRKKIITDNWNAWQTAYNQEGVQNAQSVTPAVPPDATQTAPAAAPPQSAPIPAGPPTQQTSTGTGSITPGPAPSGTGFAPYQAPTSSAFGGQLGRVAAAPAMQTVATKGVGIGHVPPRVSPHHQAVTAWHAAKPRRPKVAA